MGGKKWPSEHLCVRFLVNVCVCLSECVFVCMRLHVFPHVYEHACVCVDTWCVRVRIHAVCVRRLMVAAGSLGYSPPLY